jgi:MYXO-CTERM domain-containing protein
MRIAEQVKKPLYLGEFGWQILRREGSGLPERDKIFKAAFDHGLTTRIAGIAYWHMTNETNPAKVTYFGEILRTDLLQTKYSDKDVPHDQLFTFDVLCPADKTTCGLISSFSAKMTAKTQKPDAPYPCSAKEFLCLGECVDIYTDPENCGSCGNKCQADNACSLARCLNEPPSGGGEGGAGGAGDDDGAGNAPQGGAGTQPPVPSPTDEGCSMAPASTGTSWGWALGLVAALPLLRRRRRASN